MLKYFLCMSIMLMTAQLLSAQDEMIEHWRAVLKLDENLELPFQMTSHRKTGKGANYHQFTIHNGEEQLQIDDISIDKDMTILSLPYFDSQLKVKLIGNKMEGHWHNYAKGPDYSIPFTAEKSESSRFLNTRTSNCDVSGQWATVFSPGTADNYPAVGEFYQSEGKVTGTFMTLTGDYRFLEGTVDGNVLRLSCFDGAHAFLFQAEIADDCGSMKGQFYSGTHWSEPWEATFVETLELPDPYGLTSVISQQEPAFSLPNLNGETVSLKDDRYKDKVVLIQVLGSWCPNCLDESRFYSKMYNKYREQGLEIIGLAYESETDTTKALAKLKQYAGELGIEYEILLAGRASKKAASADFPMLSGITSFPTTIFLNRSGQIAKVHTGFNGPATSLYYPYVRDFTTFLQELLQEDK